MRPEKSEMNVLSDPHRPDLLPEEDDLYLRGGRMDDDMPPLPLSSRPGKKKNIFQILAQV